MDVSKNITALLASDKCLETWKNLLLGSRAALMQLADEDRINDVDLVPVSEGPPDKIKDYPQLAAVYPFLADFTFIEYYVFEKTLTASVESVINPGRRKGTTIAEAVQQRENDVIVIKQAFCGLRLNAITDEFQYKRINPKTGKSEWYTSMGDDLNQLSIDLAVEHGENIPKERAIEAFKFVAKRNLYEPQVDMLDKARQKYPRMSVTAAKKFLSTIGEVLLGINPEEPTIDGNSMRNVYMARYFVAMAHLARHPGCILHWMPIIVGKQGSGKSQLCRCLIPSEFNATLFNQESTPMEILKREPFRLHSGFLIELSEIDEKMQSQKQVEPLKNMITTAVDNCRRPYSPQTQRMVRRFGFIGTTNRAELFQDSTGERRFLPFVVLDDFELPWVKLQNGLNEKIWAAADIIAQTMRGDERELVGFTAEEQQFLTEYQTSFSQTDPWEPALVEYVREHRIFTPTDALTNIGLDQSQQSRVHIRRLGTVLKKLFGPSIEYKQMRHGTVKSRFWVVTGDLPFDEITEAASKPMALDRFVEAHQIKGL